MRPERPDDPFVLFNLGVSAIERRELPEALGFLERSLAGSAPSDSIVCKLFALIARTHQMMGDSRAALAACGRGLELMPDDAELWFRKGIVHRHRGESTEAEQCWRLILTLTRPEQFRSVDPGIYGHLTRRNLAALAAERGDQAGARAIVGGRAGRVPGRSRGTGEAGAGGARRRWRRRFGPRRPVKGRMAGRKMRQFRARPFFAISRRATGIIRFIPHHRRPPMG